MIRKVFSMQEIQVLLPGSLQGSSPLFPGLLRSYRVTAASRNAPWDVLSALFRPWEPGSMEGMEE
jgi:hypothetical protein